MCATEEVESEQTLIWSRLFRRSSWRFRWWRSTDSRFCGTRPRRLLHIPKKIHLLRSLPWRLRQATSSNSSTSISQARRPLDSLLLDHIQRHIIIRAPIIQRARIRHWSIHHPSPTIVLGPDEILNLGFVRHMTHSQFMLPVLICPCIPPPQHGGHLLVGPGVQIHRLHPRDMHAHAAVDARAADAYEDADVPGGPSWVLVALAVSA